MDNVTQQNAALVEEASAASKSMEQQSGTLVTQIGYFRRSDGSGITGSGSHAHAHAHAPAEAVRAARSLVRVRRPSVRLAWCGQAAGRGVVGRRLRPWLAPAAMTASGAISNRRRSGAPSKQERRSRRTTDAVNVLLIPRRQTPINILSAVTDTGRSPGSTPTDK